ncbi:helix-turn-helix domain-containing protein [Turicibacter sanguinis]|uniref:helix-turn-helix domain-containing protein n=1 Tax=Turicibacter sanguinis TaxID=154288 RepID=UPI0021D4FB3E|nr:helix-turn-helix transcriptional regulator [Turicibacter sanguinis]MCU7192644.1 helix-turn-helix domain-containing protein [Turicibacter sanguinis]
MYERLKTLRKELKLSQVEFGKRINLSGPHIGSYETGRRKLTSRTIEDICREFNVNKYWLLNGEGEMFLPQNDNDVAEYIKSLNMSDFEMELLEKFLQFDSQTRINILEFATKTFNIPPQAKEMQPIKTEVELAEEAYIKSVSKLAPNTDYSVTNTTSDKNKEKLKVVK